MEGVMEWGCGCTTWSGEGDHLERGYGCGNANGRGRDDMKGYGYHGDDRWYEDGTGYG